MKPSQKPSYIPLSPSLPLSRCGVGHPPVPPMRFHSRRSPILSSRGIAATSQPLASDAALRVLRAGGNAADAAVAAAASLNVLEPCMTGVGGDAFCLFYDAASRTVRGLHGPGRSPAALDLQAAQAAARAEAQAATYTEEE